MTADAVRKYKGGTYKPTTFETSSRSSRGPEFTSLFYRILALKASTFVDAKTLVYRC